MGRRNTTRSARILDLVFLIGVVFKGLDGLAEFAAGIPLLFVTPAGVTAVVHRLTAGELLEDPHDLISNLLVHGTRHLPSTDLRFLGVYLLIHGLVKLAIVIAIAVGATRVYPQAIVALLALTVFQVVEFVLHPTLSVAVLSVVDMGVIALTWREWRQNRSLRDTASETWQWLCHRGAVQTLYMAMSGRCVPARTSRATAQSDPS